jgi:dihydropteroate synthase
LREVPVEVGEIRIGSRYPVRIMGVVNLSPESFYQASVVEGEASLVAKVKSMTERGADIIDIGGVSSSPRNIYQRESVGIKQEIERVSEALEALRGITSVPVSIDTTSAEVAEVALDLGADMVNDVSGLTGDPRMADLVSDRGAPVVIMASCGERCASVQIALESLKKSLEIASEAKICRDRVIVDPGIGFGKPSRVDFDILRNLRFFTYLGHPVLIGLSRKAFIGQELDQESPSSRLLGSIAATSLAVFNGADMIRTHDVLETLVAVRIGEATRGGTNSRSDG